MDFDGFVRDIAYTDVFLKGILELRFSLFIGITLNIDPSRFQFPGQERKYFEINIILITI